jgi:hypothetical protein
MIIDDNLSNFYISLQKQLIINIFYQDYKYLISFLVELQK